MNTRSAMGGTGGRFAPTKVAAPGDYSDARPSAFTKSQASSGRANTGFGGSVSRISTFEAAAAAAAKNAPDFVYDGAYTRTGAFSSATEPSGPSAAFASKSRQLLDTTIS